MLHPPPYAPRQVSALATKDLEQFRDRAMSPYEQNVVSLVTAEVRKALLREIRRRLQHGRLRLGPVHLLKRALPELSMVPSGTKLALLSSAATELARHCMRDAIDRLHDIPDTECISVARALHGNASILDVKCHLPRVKKARRPRSKKPKTLVEARAEAASSSLKNWKRKAALAKTKIAALQRKVARYRKNGALT